MGACRGAPCLMISMPFLGSTFETSLSIPAQSFEEEFNIEFDVVIEGIVANNADVVICDYFEDYYFECDIALLLTFFPPCDI